MAQTKKTTKKESGAKKAPTKKTSSPKKVVTKAAAPKAEPKTMEELLATSGYEITVPQKGTTTTGLVTAVTRKMVLVDIGAKTEGIVADREFEAAREFVEGLKVGDEIDVYVVSEENEKGQILLSLKRAMMTKLWDMLEDYLKSDKEVQVKGVEINRGGMIVKWQGLRGFVPTSQFGAKWAGDLGKLIDEKFGVKPIEVDREKNRLIFSEKHVSEADQLARREAALDTVKVGEKYEGVVTGVMSFGAFVAVDVPVAGEKKGVGTVEGLVHISEISWEKVDRIEDYLKVGDKVSVKVLGVEEGTGKLNLSIKQLIADPWDSVEKNYAEGTKVTGTVSRVAPYGVFVHFEPGVDGLIHVSKLPSGREMKVGEKIDVFVENLEPERRRMSLNVVLTEVPVGYK